MARETLVVTAEGTPLDLLIWRHTRRDIPGLLERVLADPANYGLADLGPLPPVGTRVVVDIPTPARKVARPVVSLYD